MPDISSREMQHPNNVINFTFILLQLESESFISLLTQLLFQ